MKKLSTLCLAVLLLVALAEPAWADYAAGRAAYNKADYATALKELRPLAGQGNAKAQHMLGVMYDNGKGVPKDYQQAAYWYRKAAEQGNAKAQTDLGAMYSGGFGVPKDYVLAYMWFHLAAAQGDKAAGMVRWLVAKQMTPAQIVEAKRMAKGFTPKME